jgi:hypothetical protein
VRESVLMSVLQDRLCVLLSLSLSSPFFSSSPFSLSLHATHPHPPRPHTHRDLNEHDIINRIMRKDNYLIAMVNKGVVSPYLPLPRWLGLGRRRATMTKTLGVCVCVCMCVCVCALV